eukprot:3655673-Rhodomonas_salina.2
MVTELTKTLMDLKETLLGSIPPRSRLQKSKQLTRGALLPAGTQNKAAEIEIGSALHKHVVSSVQNAEVLEGAPDSARQDRIKMSEALDLCLKSVSDRRQVAKPPGALPANYLTPGTESGCCAACRR